MAKKTKKQKANMVDSGDISKASPVGSDVGPDGMRDYEHEDNARTLMKAGEIMSDSKKMKGAHKHIKKQKLAMRSVADLIKHRNTTFGKEDPTEDVDADGM